ncbi:hypothetical protein G4Y79_13455 [Phototrophicus methaneseepsis]|uniref:Uroporphyrinogen decarboxylase (URO-D) domain-containing protein n=1 Tax=Phototrophicus methaneseepsis TaxID=2710758 RepID=A0A7S8E5E6_9CHLR|nr:uroporphyrinogen decarboxylase family protein [Phototrophicus methaneseepsis]QPC80718.1 hypothetical protein G4Y79_13455 [Phototrophicus methaneseepsis]
MNKQERLKASIAGDAVDRAPAILYRYWPGDDQRAADLARAHILFQQQYDWDALIITPSANYSVIDYGVQDAWTGHTSGMRQITKHIISRSLGWTELRTLEPTRGALSQQIACVNLLENAVSEEIPLLFQVYSPLSLAAKLAGPDQLLRHLRTYPERVKTGLSILTESVLRVIEALQRTRIAGIYYIMENADLGYLSQSEYGEFGAPYDWTVFDALLPRLWLNMAELRGTAPLVTYVSSYPAQVLTWDDQGTDPNLITGRSVFTGSVMGGLSADAHLHHGTPAIIRDAARHAQAETQHRRFILGAGGPIPVTCPLSNIQAARDAVERDMH